MPLHRVRGVGVRANRFDFIELSDQVGKSIILIVVCVYRKETMKPGAEDFQIALGQ